MTTRSKKRSRLSDNYVEGVDHPTPMKKKSQYSESDLFNQMLPDQVLVKIFSYFEYKDLLLAAALVCKRWEKLSSDSDLWQSLDLSRLPGRSDISTRTVAKLVKRTTGMKHINLKNCGNISNIVISNIAKQEMLRTLILHECYRPSSESLASIANCRLLEHLDLQRTLLDDDALGMIAESCTNLVYLDISWIFCITTRGLLPVVQHCTKLRCLQMDHCLQVRDDFLVALAAKPSQIESLVISNCSFTEDGLQHLRKLSKLRRIDASGVTNRCRGNDLASIFSNLTCLRLNKIKDINDDGVSTIVRNNPNLEILSLSGCTSVGNNALKIISKSPCRFTLTNLVIDNSSTTEKGIFHILRNCAKLQSLTFSKMFEDTAQIWLMLFPQVEFYTAGKHSIFDI